MSLLPCFSPTSPAIHGSKQPWPASTETWDRRLLARQGDLRVTAASQRELVTTLAEIYAQPTRSTTGSRGRPACLTACPCEVALFYLGCDPSVIHSPVPAMSAAPTQTTPTAQLGGRNADYDNRHHRLRPDRHYGQRG